jgi:hypothetical protein
MYVYVRCRYIFTRIYTSLHHVYTCLHHTSASSTSNDIFFTYILMPTPAYTYRVAPCLSLTSLQRALLVFVGRREAVVHEQHAAMAQALQCVGDVAGDLRL